jgi:uncharacterized protein (TIGR03435 family)
MRTLLCVGLLVLSSVAFRQVGENPRQAETALQSNATPDPRFHFEASSLRLFPLLKFASEHPTRLRCRAADGELFPNPSNRDAVPLGRCTGTFFPSELIEMAYASESMFKMTGVPAEFDVGAEWAYQIQAVAPNPSRVTKVELQKMLQALLRDRFKLKTHREMREVDGFHLMVATGGIKFKETSLDEQSAVLQPQDDRAPVPPPEEIYPVMMKGRFGMKQFAEGGTLGTLLDRPVVDKTNLPGVYEITFLIELIMPTGIGRGAGEPASRLQTSASIPKALEQQLGLRLQPAKVPVEFLIIDHIEKATEN